MAATRSTQSSLETLDKVSDFRLLTISLLAAVVGVIGGVIAYVLYTLIGLVTNLVFFQRWSTELIGLQHNTLGAWVILVPVIGGLLVGLIAKYGTDKIRGHGIPEAMEAVLTNRSRISLKVTLLKPISAVIAIGTGGPFGAEGPIIQTGGGLGSLIGQIIRTTAAERKVLLACGAAAGMAATFSTPIAAVVIAIELLLFEFRPRSFIPLVISSTLATSVHFYLIGPGPMFEVGKMDFGMPYGLPFYLVLGVICGFAAVGLSRFLYWMEDMFERLPFDELWWPALGALGLGVIGFFVPRVLGVGYDTISDILNGRLPLLVLLSVLVFKTLALIVSLASGTSGGLLAPTFMASAALGSVFAIAVNHVIPGVHLSPGAYALVAMAAVFAAASRATFALIIFAFEITRNYNSILPLMLVCVVASGVAMRYMKNTIMTEKLERRGLKVNQDYEVDVFRQITVGEVMDERPTTIPSDMVLADLAERITHNDPFVTRHHALPIVDAKDRLVGIITREETLRLMEQTDADAERTVGDVAGDSVVFTYEDELMHDAVLKMLRHNIGGLPVVSRHNTQELLGFLGRTEVLEARIGRMREEFMREHSLFRVGQRRRIRRMAARRREHVS